MTDKQKPQLTPGQGNNDTGIGQKNLGGQQGQQQGQNIGQDQQRGQQDKGQNLGRDRDDDVPGRKAKQTEGEGGYRSPGKGKDSID